MIEGPEDFDPNHGLFAEADHRRRAEEVFQRWRMFAVRHGIQIITRENGSQCFRNPKNGKEMEFPRGIIEDLFAVSPDVFDDSPKHLDWMLDRIM